MMLFSHWLFWLKNGRFSKNSSMGFIVSLKHVSILIKSCFLFSTIFAKFHFGILYSYYMCQWMISIQITCRSCTVNVFLEISSKWFKIGWCSFDSIFLWKNKKTSGISRFWIALSRLSLRTLVIAVKSSDKADIKVFWSCPILHDLFTFVKYFVQHCWFANHFQRCLFPYYLSF